jgi:meso-butanediol dehydrogenase/(S,S)-butanediol dehydrogenase/diacetyl reductase
MRKRFAGRVAAVTGSASGIGAATVERLVAEGARVLIGDVNEEGGRGLAERLGEATAFRRVDVRDAAEVAAFVGAAVERFGRLDVLVNNAGTAAYGRTPDLDPELWRMVIDVDLHSVFYGCRAAIPHFRRAGGGVIVNTASISGLHADFGLAAYNAAKAAVVNYTRAVAIDHAHEGIRANCVCPGPIETPLIHPFVGNEGIAADYLRAVPLGRLGRPEEVAAAIAFLASDDAAYVTGAALVVDGGVTASTGQPNFSRFLGDV